MAVETLRFTDGTEPLTVDVLVKAESILFARDDQGRYFIIKSSKVADGDPAEEVQFTDEVDLDDKAITESADEY
jgi:hypothetical protein